MEVHDLGSVMHMIRSKPRRLVVVDIIVETSWLILVMWLDVSNYLQKLEIYIANTINV